MQQFSAATTNLLQECSLFPSLAQSRCKPAGSNSHLAGAAKPFGALPLNNSQQPSTQWPRGYGVLATPHRALCTNKQSMHGKSCGWRQQGSTYTGNPRDHSCQQRPNCCGASTHRPHSIQYHQRDAAVHVLKGRLPNTAQTHTVVCGGVWCVAHTAGVLQSRPGDTNHSEGNNHSAGFDGATINLAVV